MSHVLIVDDEAAMRAGLEASFRRCGWHVQWAAGVAEALHKFRQAPARVVATDMCIPDGTGLPLIAVNCAAFPDHLLESELFGFSKGAFTGATSSKPGKFALANGGTLLLDEIGEMALGLQPKLLRVLQQREIDPLGETRSVPIDVRVIATTNRNLPEQISRGLFREDLFYRLNVVPLTLPALRDRRADIVPLAEYFLRKYAEQDRGEHCQLSEEFVAQLEAHDWPGNVRELENCIRRALALRSGATLQAPATGFLRGRISEKAASSVQAGGTLYEAERQLVGKKLGVTGGNRTP